MKILSRPFNYEILACWLFIFMFRYAKNVIKNKYDFQILLSSNEDIYKL